MEEKRLDRRSFLKYAGVGSLATLSLMIGGTRTAQAQFGIYLEALGRVPEQWLTDLPEILAEINEHRDRLMEPFMTDARDFLRNNYGIEIPFTEWQIMVGDLSTEDTLWPKFVTDPLYPYEGEIKISLVVIGFAYGTVYMGLREIGT